jgi:murein L,D-transpeptidase YcbB/YkuD
VAAAVTAARPQVAQYEALRAALARYRTLATDPVWQSALPPLPGSNLEPGKPWPGLPGLAQRLAALGDLPVGSTLPARYEGALVAGVEAFQQRHGLTPDGVIGKATLEALAVTPAARVRQLELALERLRWTPQPERA